VTNEPRRVVITGGMGFVGSHLAEAMIRLGDSVTVIDDLSTGQRANVAHLEGHPRFRSVVDDIRSTGSRSLFEADVDLIVHLAAVVGVRRVVERPVETIINNVEGTQAVLSAARSSGATVIVTSTSEVYGNSTRFPFSEGDDVVIGPSVRPRWGYAVSKLADEFLALGYWREEGMPVVVARLFNIVGPRQSDQYVLPRFARAALKGEPLQIYGDGEQTRCFTHIDDAVDAFVALGACEEAIGQVVNIGASDEITVLGLAHRVLGAVGDDSAERLQMVPYAQAFDKDFEDMQRRVPDTTRLTALTGWRSQRSLDQMIADVIEDQARQLGMSVSSASDQRAESTPTA
jgi:UDP-glucose 4-epimerase